MPKFRVLKQQDAFVEYEGIVEAPTAKDAVDAAYEFRVPVKWKKVGIAEYDASRVVALDEDGNEIDNTVRGRF